MSSNKLPYPVNAYIDGALFRKTGIIRDKEAWEHEREQAIEKYMNDPLFPATFEYVLASTMTESEQEMIHLYHRDGHTMESIAKMKNLSSSRVGQIIHKAWMKLHHPRRSEILALGIDEYYKSRAEEQARKARDEGYKEGYADGYKTAYSEKLSDPEKVIEAIPEVPLEDLGLTVRAYNCLKRAGINTLRELAKSNPTGVAKARNLGKRSFCEVVDVLEHYGIDTYEYKKILNNYSAVVNGKYDMGR